MNQIINIFRKDFRQHWYVIVLSLAILVAFAWNEPSLWVPEVPQHLREIVFHSMFAGWLATLVVIGWMILIVRVVHGESLVGDRQFWITRPYEWKKLLTAKALFFVSFINLPLLIVQVVLLWRAGFAPTSNVTGLLWAQFLWVLVLMLPITALATVTSRFGQTVLVSLLIPVLLIGRMALSSVIPNTGLPVTYSIQESLQNLVLLGACAAVVIWQYARRRTLPSRLLLIGAATVALVIMVVMPHQALTAYMYPQPSASRRLPVQLEFDRNGKTDKEGWPMKKDEVGIHIPLLVPGRLEDSAVAVNGTMVEIEAPGGLRWNSGWQGYSSFLPPDQLSTDTRFEVDRGFFEKVKSGSAKLHIWFALTTFRAKEARRIVVASDEFVTPPGSLCSIYSSAEQPNLIYCRAPLKYPPLVVTTLSEETTCPFRGDEKVAPPGTTFSAWQSSPDSSPAGLGFDPVKFFPLNLAPRLGTIENFRAYVCPGTPLTFRIVEEGQRTRGELTIEGIRLADYQVKDSPPGATQWGILH